MNLIKKQLVVEAPIARAFEVFAATMGTWWPVEHHIGKTAFAAIVIEPRVGGRWFERGTDGTECQWGKVLVWEPPARLVLAWQLDSTFKYDPALVTEVDIRFTAIGERSTRVEFEHRNLDRFGEVAAKIGPMMDEGWGQILASYTTTAHSPPSVSR